MAPFISQRSLVMTPLRLRMIEDMQIRNLAAQTQKSYIEHIVRFARHLVLSQTF
jgi:integrase/recombinase XerD